MKTEIWAHRGASNTYIENSIPAFKHAIDIGVDGIELDVHRTFDGKLVVFHDSNLKRLTNHNQFIWDTPWSELQKMTLMTEKQSVINNVWDNKIPLLEDVLMLIKGTGITINIELKNNEFIYPYLEDDVLRCVDKVSIQENILYSSFNHLSINYMSSIVGAKKCAILSEDIKYSPASYIKKIGASSYNPNINSLGVKDLITDLHKSNIKINVWTADKASDIHKSLLLGVDSIITNHPNKAIKLRDEFHTNGLIKTAKHLIKSDNSKH